MNRGLKTLALFAAFVVVFTISRHLGSRQVTVITTSSTTSTVVATTVVPQCQGHDMTGVDDGGQAAQGTAFDSVTLTKTSAGICRLRGYPTLTMQDSTGAVVPFATVPYATSSGLTFPSAQANQPPMTLTVAMGQSVVFSYAFVDRSATNCPAIRTVNVQMHTTGSATPVTLRFNEQVCGTSVTVSPFYAG